MVRARFHLWASRERLGALIGNGGGRRLLSQVAVGSTRREVGRPATHHHRPTYRRTGHPVRAWSTVVSIEPPQWLRITGVKRHHCNFDRVLSDICRFM